MSTEAEKRVAKCNRLVEWYFGDINYPRDAWMKEKAAEDKEGWIPVSAIVDFGRMKPLKVAVEELSELCKDSEVVMFSEDKTMMKRKTAAPEEAAIDDAASVYFKGLPTDQTLDDLEEFFAGIAPFMCINMRRSRDKSFKGSCYVQFKSVESAKKVLESKPKYGETELIVLTKADHIAEMAAQRDAGAGKRKASDRQIDSMDFKRGTVLCLSGIGKEPEATREDLRDMFAKYGEISFISYSRGQETAEVRFAEEGAAEKAIAEVHEKLSVGGAPVKATTLSEEDEKEYYKTIAARCSEKRARGGARGGRRGGRGRGRR